MVAIDWAGYGWGKVTWKEEMHIFWPTSVLFADLKHSCIRKSGTYYSTGHSDGR